MQTWFECKAKFIKIDESGRERKVTEKSIIDAVSFTDAETRITQKLGETVRGEFSVIDIKQSNVTEIFQYDEGEWWYKGKINLVTIDERYGKEKRIAEYFLVNANDLEQALLRLRESLSYILVPFQIESIAFTQVAEVYPYFEIENKEQNGNSDQSE